VAPPSLHLELRNEPAATSALRAALDRISDACGLANGDRFDLKVAATEAVTNALRGLPATHSVDVSLTGQGDAVEVEVRDRGTFAPFSMRGPDAEGGRGIPLMLALVDEVEFAASRNGTRVRMRKRVARAGEDAEPL
jgi:serine/threonine-protein kinase RsbW